MTEPAPPRAAALPRLDRAEATAALLPPLLVAAERIASSVALGIHGRRRAGPGEDFWEFRRHQPGDSPSRIDWRRSARADPLFVREHEWEAAQAIWIACDRSPSMAYASRRSLPWKAARAMELALALASLLVRGGERIALAGHDTLPAQGRAALVRMALALSLESNAHGPEAAWSAPIARHGRMVILGDFLDPIEDLRAGLRRLAGAGVRGHLVQILDPAEETLPFEGRMRFDGLEGEPPVLVDRVEAVRTRYQRRLAAHRDQIAALARRHGWGFLAHHTDQPPRLALLALYRALSETPPRRTPGTSGPTARTSG
ncbi:DUF58 domain-containing protein [Pararhodospirillum photometricum]|uniref:DUF58 domain-containing protein n=1 Tax=Pararhodospirillum photometricum DSM 122 TaxID=1150469 RepID=H6SSB0_PARPM|nr:DUF58 domain-containing protein [Pararhodospirillum photometricum]CCG07789.1 Putative uncharacterized protein [Pararhodospirillum photometricum DSM 122]